jgi:hypothetical protein
VYTVLPPEARDWARAQGIPEPPPEVESPAAGSEQQVASLSGGSARPLVMSSPDRGATYRLDPGLPRDAQKIVISARPGAGVSLAQVTLFVDGRPLAQFGAPPYRLLWRLEPGMHIFSAGGVTDSGQRVASDETQIEVRE